MIERLVNLPKKHSYFLFGNRGVGKSTLLKKLFSPDQSIWIDLLDPKVERKFALNPSLLNAQLDEAAKKFPKNTFVVKLLT